MEITHCFCICLITHTTHKMQLKSGRNMVVGDVPMVHTCSFTVVDPGFPIGGHQPHRGADSQGSSVLKILYVEMKESGPLGGGGHAPGTHPKFANVLCVLII